MFELIFDLETKKLFSDINSNNPGDLGVSIVSAYFRELNDNLEEVSGKLYSYWETDLERFWPQLQKADRIIGFNSLHFDVPALQPYASFRLDKVTSF